MLQIIRESKKESHTTSVEVLSSNGNGMREWLTLLRLIFLWIDFANVENFGQIRTEPLKIMFAKINLTKLDQNTSHKNKSAQKL